MTEKSARPCWAGQTSPGAGAGRPGGIRQKRKR